MALAAAKFSQEPDASRRRAPERSWPAGIESLERNARKLARPRARRRCPRGFVLPLAAVATFLAVSVDITQGPLMGPFFVVKALAGDNG
jgi:hypothetical protein